MSMANGASGRPVTPTISAVSLPAWVRAESALDRIDYSDCYLVENVDRPATMTAEQWAREVLEQAPPRLRRRLTRGWRALGLRHGSLRSPNCVLGWPIRSNAADCVVLGARSHVGLPAELFFASKGETWLFATLVQHDNPIVATIWRAMAHYHRRVVSYLLRTAAARLTQSAPLS
jgi:hypothetical protein